MKINELTLLAEIELYTLEKYWKDETERNKELHDNADKELRKYAKEHGII